MKEPSVNMRRIVLILIFILLILPLVQVKFKIVNLTPLKGAISTPEKKYFNFSDWFSGVYQQSEENYLNETFGFRNLFVKINNQLAYSLFKEAKAKGVVIGKENYLYEENYIKAYYGIDFIGKDSIKNRMQRIKYIQDTLKKLNKSLILIFAAGKGSFYPEYFPDSCKMKQGLTNCEEHVRLAKETGINYIDFNDYFIKNKNKSKYPLYPQLGIHWSYYGMCLAADSIIRYLEKLRKIDMPNLYWKDVELDDARETDYDIADGMNLFSRLKSFKMAYPKIQIQSDSSKVKPSILVVADSYYWGMYNFGFTWAFSKNKFWFYNQQVYPDFHQNGLLVSQVNLKDEINNYDIIVIMATEATLPNFGWGFIENTYDLFKGIKKASFDPDFRRKVDDLRNYIKTDKNWMEAIEKKATLYKISVDSMITTDAIWQIQHEKNK
jgi:hypothetical protein